MHAIDSSCFDDHTSGRSNAKYFIENFPSLIVNFLVAIFLSSTDPYSAEIDDDFASMTELVSFFV